MDTLVHLDSLHPFGIPSGQECNLICFYSLTRLLETLDLGQTRRVSVEPNTSYSVDLSTILEEDKILTHEEHEEILFGVTRKGHETGFIYELVNLT